MGRHLIKIKVFVHVLNARLWCMVGQVRPHQIDMDGWYIFLTALKYSASASFQP